MAIVTDRSRKWLIAGVMGFLTVAFALPSWFGQGQGGGRVEVTKGTVFGSEPVTASEIERAKDEWQFLSEVEMNFMGVRVPMALRVFMGDLGQYQNAGPDEFMLAYRGAMVGMAEVSRDPEVWALLKREALKRGLRPSQDRIQTFLTNEVRIDDKTPPRIAEPITAMAPYIIAVSDLGDVLTRAIKPTRPQVQSDLARFLQSLDVTVALIDAGPLREKVPTPPESAARELFEKFASRPPGESDTRSNPFGFGYLQPDRVSIDYVGVPRSELARVSRGKLNDYDWEVEAQKYYQKNQTEFMTSAPVTTAPSDGFSLGGTGSTATQRLRPFAEVRELIVTRLVNERADQLSGTLQRRVASMLSSDYRAYADAMLQKQPVPASSVGPAFNTYEYLKALAGKVEQDTGVRVNVTTLGDRAVDAERLAREPGVGAAEGTPSGMTRPVPLAAFIFQRAKPLLDARAGGKRQTVTTPALDLFEPTPWFTNPDGTAFIARVTTAQPSRVPQFAEVEAEARADALVAAAQQAAVTAGEELAKTNPGTLLAGLAAGRNLRYARVPELSERNPIPPELAITTASRQDFLTGAYGLLRTDPVIDRPRAVVSLPRDRKVAVVELIGVKPLAADLPLHRFELQNLREHASVNRALLLNQFFTREATETRTGWKPAAGATTAPAN